MNMSPEQKQFFDLMRPVWMHVARVRKLPAYLCRQRMLAVLQRKTGRRGTGAIKQIHEYTLEDIEAALPYCEEMLEKI